MKSWNIWLSIKTCKWFCSIYCRRDPTIMVKPLKSGESDNDRENELKKVKPSKTRHLFLIRHGQYELEPGHDVGRILTQKGMHL